MNWLINLILWLLDQVANNVRSDDSSDMIPGGIDL